jgi:hypothetical protein
MNEVKRVCSESKKRVKKSMPRIRKQTELGAATKYIEITYIMRVYLRLENVMFN